jgi:hypothetical protein
LRVLAHFAEVPPHELWLATTDADSTVPHTWLRDQITLADGGAEAIAGTVHVQDWRCHSLKLARAFAAFYAPPGCSDQHEHVHGANLGVRADAYLAAPAFTRATGEDHALWNALREANRNLVSTRRVCVTTSARREGRAPNGFAESLLLLDETGGDIAPFPIGSLDSFSLPRDVG